MEKPKNKRASEYARQRTVNAGIRLRNECREIVKQDQLTVNDRTTMRDYIKNAYKRLLPGDLPTDEWEDLKAVLRKGDFGKNYIPMICTIGFVLGMHEDLKRFIEDEIAVINKYETIAPKLIKAITYAEAKVMALEMIEKGEKDYHVIVAKTGLPNKEVWMLVDKLNGADEISFKRERQSVFTSWPDMR